MRSIWITRTQPGAQSSAERFRRLDLSPIIAPLLTVAPPPLCPPPPPDNAILIFTAQNGVRAFCTLSDKRHYPVITVGDKTAELARDFGFTDVRSAKGDARAVSALILNAPDRDRPYAHIAGRHLRGSIVQDLHAAGLTASRAEFYVSDPVGQCPDIDLKPADIIALYSPLAARTLAAFQIDLSPYSVLCISAATADALSGQICGDLLVANSPDEPAMISALQQHLAFARSADSR